MAREGLMDDTGYDPMPYEDSFLEEVEKKGYDSGYADGVKDTSFEKGRGCIHKCDNGNKCYELVREKDETLEKLKKECDRYYGRVRE